MSEYISSSERAKVIRKALAKHFGNSNVSVRKGTGTASCWVEAHIYAERPQDCACNWSSVYWNGTQAPKPFRIEKYCESCSTAWKTADEQAKKLSDEAMKAKGYEHSTYYVDDGYNSESSEFLLQTSVN